MDEKPEALRLADVPICERSITWQSDATIELRRLHGVNQELLAALDEIAINTHDDTAEQVARAAIRARGQG